MFGGGRFAGLVFAGTEFFARARRRPGPGVGGITLFPDLFNLPTEVDRKRRRRREHVLAIREDEDNMMDV